MPEPLSADRLRWSFDPKKLPFETTADVEPIASVVAQESALEAIRFGLESTAPGQNIFVRGVSGTGRMMTVRRLIDELRPVCRAPVDRAYVHNFTQAERPRLITLPSGRAPDFRRAMRRFAEFVSKDLQRALESDSTRSRRDSIEAGAKQSIEAATKPLEEELQKAGFALVSRQTDVAVLNEIYPTHEEKPVSPEEYDALRQAGEISDDRHAQVERDAPVLEEKLREMSLKVADLYRDSAQRMRTFLQNAARETLEEQTRPIAAQFKGAEGVAEFLGEVVDELVERRLSSDSEPFDPFQLFGVNVVRTAENDDCPVVVENHPTLGNLVGAVDPEWQPSGQVFTDYRRIRAGSLLRADGGYLILDGRDVLQEPAAWKVLKRTLRHSVLEIVPPEATGPFAATALKPEPIPLRVRVVLVGDSMTYGFLDSVDPEFRELFKVLADFDSVTTADQRGVEQYAGVLARLREEEEVMPFDRGGVVRLAEHGCRIASHRRKLTTRFGRVADLAREASFLAGKRGVDVVSREDVEEAVRRTKVRGGLPSRRFQELVKAGTLRIDTSGEIVGQINGLAVTSAGEVSYGFPARITATIAPGNAGIIDIEGSSSMSGSIHTKGFHILGGLMRQLLRTAHPLTFSASLTFEQSYGGIDGDSASGAEAICLLSALTGIPIRQNLAITGAIDQIGHLQAIGGVNEKIEGFFDIQRECGVGSPCGVVIPTANVDDLQLRTDVVEACERGEFEVHAFEWIHDAIELFTGRPAGSPSASGEYAGGTVLDEAQKRAREYWRMTARPSGLDEPSS